jgi:polyisoprenoid-binding protein YceI
MRRFVCFAAAALLFLPTTASATAWELEAALGGPRFSWTGFGVGWVLER